MEITYAHFKKDYANIGWVSSELGWGEIQFYGGGGEELIIDSENMEKEFVMKVLEQLVAGAKLRHHLEE